MNRFQQTTSNFLSTGTIPSGALILGGSGGTIEVTNFGPQVRPIIAGVTADGSIIPSYTTGSIEPCFLQDNICIYDSLLERILYKPVELYGTTLHNEGGFCNQSLDNGAIVSAPASAGFPPTFATGGVAKVPTIIRVVCPQDL